MSQPHPRPCSRTSPTPPGMSSGWAPTRRSIRPPVALQEHDGGTLVVLRHHGLPSDEQRHHHRAGWVLYLDRLRLRMGGGDPGPDPNS